MTTRTQPRTDTEIRRLMLQYFYDRNHNSTSRRGKKTGAGASIATVRTDLKREHGLTAQEVLRNLTFLLSEKWVEVDKVSKSFRTKSGATMPAETEYYVITSAGMTKIEGRTEFTRDRFEGINLGSQNVITIGDNNYVQARFEEAGQALLELREEVRRSTAFDAAEKVDLISDISGVQDQLAKRSPDGGVIGRLWTGIRGAAASRVADALVAKVGALLGGLITGGGR